jgi:hypothetical protein
LSGKGDKTQLVNDHELLFEQAFFQPAQLVLFMSLQLQETDKAFLKLQTAKGSGHLVGVDECHDRFVLA